MARTKLGKELAEKMDERLGKEHKAQTGGEAGTKAAHKLEKADVEEIAGGGVPVQNANGPIVLPDI